MPLSFDMPLKQLKTYNGTNPKPLDFDSFWERKLYEVNKIDPEIAQRAAVPSNMV